MKTRALAIVLALLAMLILAYTLAGFYLVPHWVQREAPRLLEDRGHRLKLGAFSFNPFTLTVRADDVAIEDAAGKPVFSAAGLIADLEWRSLLRGGAVLSEVRLVKPVLNVTIDQQGRVNLAALAKDDGKPSEGLPRFSIGELGIAEGVIAFADQREPYTHAHNDYIEFASETGVVGIGLLGLLVVMSFGAALRAQYLRNDPLMRGISFGAIMGIMALMIHSSVDFNLQIPANALTFMLLLAFAWVSLHHRQR